MTQIFLVLDSAGAVVNRIVADAGFSPGPGLRLVPDDGRPAQFPAPIAEDAQAWQLKVVLSRMPSKIGHAGSVLDDADAVAATAGGAVQLAWANAPSIRRNSPTLAQLAPALGLTQADIDAAFTTAASVVI